MTFGLRVDERDEVSGVWVMGEWRMSGWIYYSRDEWEMRQVWVGDLMWEWMREVREVKWVHEFWVSDGWVGGFVVAGKSERWRECEWMREMRGVDEFWVRNGWVDDLLWEWMTWFESRWMGDKASGWVLGKWWMSTWLFKSGWEIM